MIMPTITLHHLEHSQSFRIVWLLEEIGMDYTLRIYPRTSDLKAPPEYKAISPLGVSPTITDGDLALCESNAIIEYILDKADRDGIDASCCRYARTQRLYLLVPRFSGLLSVGHVDGLSI
jgi:glutathione S-transferase